MRFTSKALCNSRIRDDLLSHNRIFKIKVCLHEIKQSIHKRYLFSLCAPISSRIVQWPLCTSGFVCTIQCTPVRFKNMGDLPLIPPLRLKHVRLYLFSPFCSIPTPVVFSHTYFMFLSVVRSLRKLIGTFGKRWILPFSLSVQPSKRTGNKFLRS